MTAAAVRLDRRHLRHAETVQQVVDVAVQVIAEHGAGGLSLGEVARRMGMRTPSLYVYFPSKNALYDAVFARSWQELGEYFAARDPGPDADLRTWLIASGDAFARWCVEHPGNAQLIAWRPIPEYEPAPDAYAAAVTTLERGRVAFTGLQERGLLRAGLDIDEALRVWTVLISGVVTQQLANAPGEPFETGAYTCALPELIEMFAVHYGADATRPRSRKRGST